MRLISWNLAGRRSKAKAQIAALAERHPDILALQEVVPSAVLMLQEDLVSCGFGHMVVSTLPAGRPARQTHQITTSRHPIANLPSADALGVGSGWLLSSVLDVHGCMLELHNVHVPPGSSNGWLKIAVLRDIYLRLGSQADAPRILSGDFNTPQTELRNGEVVTSGQRLRASGTWELARRIQGGSGEEWDAAERAVLTGLSHFDLEDSFRSLHEFEREEHSWYFGGLGRQIGRRFDHVFASRRLRVRRCEYLHELRTNGLSDHSPIEADFDWPTFVTLSPT